MLLSFNTDHKEHLSLLLNQSAQVIIDFCKLTIDFLQNGPNVKRYSNAAQKLQVEPENVQSCIYALVNLLLESCKHKLNEADFRDSILTLGFSREQQVIISKFYESKQKEILEILLKSSVDELHYQNLEWRFEVQVASRSLLHQVTPLVILDLCLEANDRELENDGSKQHLLLQTDPTNLIHITEELEKALIESRSRHSRKIQRGFNNTE